jgi:hypothetical protein
LYRELRRRAKRHTTLAARRWPKLWRFGVSFARAWRSTPLGEARSGEKRDAGLIAMASTSAQLGDERSVEKRDVSSIAEW